MNSESPVQNSNRNWLAFFAMLALVWAVVGRVTGPSDLWEYTQYKTLSYTSDMLIHGGRHWLVPQAGEQPATKPPLYNWIAVPFVKWLGYNSELAHKFPSILALCGCWLVVVRLGRRLDVAGDQSMGWLAGMILIANHTMFKLGYVARPDMLLTLWLTLGWVLATWLLVERRESRPGGVWAVVGFWVCIALASWTKGPAAIVGIVSAIVTARVVGGSWKALGALKPLVGLPSAVVVAGLWVYAVWRIDSNHLHDTLWKNEFYGRVTGTGTEGMHEAPGLIGVLTTLPYHPLYFLGRFFPWSLCAIAAMAMLWSERRSRFDSSFDERSILWLRSATIHVIVVIGLFSLSAGKRADYLSIAFAPASLLAAFWIWGIGPRWRWPSTWMAPAVALVVLSALTTYEHLQPSSPVRAYGRLSKRFVDEAASAIAAEPLPLAYCFTNHSFVQAMLGPNEGDGITAALRLVDRRQPFWIVSGEPGGDATFTRWLSRRSRIALGIEKVVQSPPLPWRVERLERMTLYRIEPDANGGDSARERGRDDAKPPRNSSE